MQCRSPSHLLEFRRAPRPVLIEALAPGGALGFISTLVQRDVLWDVGFRGDEAHVYRGRSCVLRVRATRTGRLRLAVSADKYREGGFEPAWEQPHDPAELQPAARSIEGYLSAAAGLVRSSFTSKEALVQGAVTHHRLSEASDVIVVDREAVPGWSGNRSEREQALSLVREPYERCAGRQLGKEADVLALSRDGSTLFVVEAKADAGPVSSAVAQACWYSALFRWWVSADPQRASRELEALATCRQRLGLAPPLARTVDIQRVVPVVAFPSGEREPGTMISMAASALVGTPGHDGATPLLWAVMR